MRNIAKLQSPDYVKPKGEKNGLSNNQSFKAGVEQTKTKNFVKISTGLDMEYAERGSGTDNIIIFLHGIVDSWFAWSEVLALMPDDYHMYAISHRGHGETTKPNSGYSMTQFADDLAAFMDAKNIQQADIIGHSMGGVIAQRFCLNYPERVKRLGLVATGANLIGNEVLVGFNEYAVGLPIPDPVTEAFARDLAESVYYKKFDPDFLNMQISETLKLPAYVWYHALAGLIGDDMRAEVPNITKPTFIIWGDKDDIFPAEDQVDLRTIPNHEFVELNNIGHANYWEEPNKFVSKLVNFLKKN